VFQRIVSHPSSLKKMELTGSYERLQGAVTQKTTIQIMLIVVLKTCGTELCTFLLGMTSRSKTSQNSPLHIR
jgi:hypothetical protein